MFRDVPGEEIGGEGPGRDGEKEAGRERVGQRLDQTAIAGYRIGLRNPQFSGAEHCCLWELKQVRISLSFAMIGEVDREVLQSSEYM